jgi:hypothetical protein
MLYDAGGGGVSRHQALRLRLPQAELNAAVAERGTHCTHFDAYRRARSHWNYRVAANTDSQP